MTKTCGNCKEEKDVSCFSRRGEGYQPWCKPCAHAKRAQWSRDNKEKTRAYRIKYRYGLSQEMFDALLKKQSNSCAICSVEFNGLKHLHVDHDHKCCGSEIACEKCVRGLLCQPCNLRLSAYENTEMMRLSLQYLENYAS